MPRSSATLRTAPSFCGPCWKSSLDGSGTGRNELWAKTVLGSHFGAGEFTHFRVPILVWKLGCSLGVQDFDSWANELWLTRDTKRCTEKPARAGSRKEVPDTGARMFEGWISLSGTECAPRWPERAEKKVGGFQRLRLARGPALEATLKSLRGSRWILEAKFFFPIVI